MTKPDRIPEVTLTTLYGEQLATMRVLQAHSFNTTLRIFGLDVLVAGAMLANVVHLSRVGQWITASVILLFHAVICLYLHEQNSAYTRRKNHLHAIEKHLKQVGDLPHGVIKPEQNQASCALLKGLVVYQIFVVLGAAFATLSILAPHVLS